MTAATRDKTLPDLKKLEADMVRERRALAGSVEYVFGFALMFEPR